MPRAYTQRIIEPPRGEFDLPVWNPVDSLPPEESPDDPLPQDMWELGHATALTAKQYGISRTFFTEDESFGEEVGDDRLDASTDPLKCAAALVVQEHTLLMKTSLPDTFISTRLWNFCEVTSRVPRMPDGSFDRARKVGDFSNLEFTDVPPLRIILDVMKGDRSHSSTVPGKATMLGSRMRTPRTEFLQDWFLASFLQDGCLRTSRSSEPKYLPQVMGGSGARVLWGVPDNLYLSVHAYRGGSCQRIYGSATNELRECLSREEAGQASAPLLCRRLRDKHEYLFGTFAEKILVPPRSMMGPAKNMPPPLLLATGGANRFAAFENRLLRTKELITRTGAEREWAHTARIRGQLLDRVTPIKSSDERLRDDSRIARREFEFALNANTAFSNLLRRKASGKEVEDLIRMGFHSVTSGVTRFTRWDGEWLFFGGKSEHFSIEDLASSEDLFVRTEVSEEESLKVGGLILRPITGRGLRTVETTSRVGLYQIGPGMSEWAADLRQRLVARRDSVGRTLYPGEAHEEFWQNPEWVNDDTSLIAKCLHDTQWSHARDRWVVLVSNDKRLANQMANTCNVRVGCLSPREYALCLRRLHLAVQGKPPAREVIHSLMEGSGNPPSHVYVDSGSLAAALAVLGQDEGSEDVYVRALQSHSLDRQSGRRECRYWVIPVPIPTKLRCRMFYPTHRSRRHRTGRSDVALSSPRLEGLRSGSRSDSGSWRKESEVKSV